MLADISPILKNTKIKPAKYIGPIKSFINHREDQLRIIPNAAKPIILIKPNKKIVLDGKEKRGDLST